MTLTVLEAEPPGVGIRELLEELMDSAKAGELSSIAVAVVHRDGGGDQRWSFAPSALALLGSANMLAYRLADEFSE